VKKEKSCGAIVFSIQNDVPHVLMIKHVHGGHWSFPKGHVEGIETEEQTAHREVFEETGIKMEIIPGYRKIVSYSPRFNVSKTVVYFLAKALCNVIVPQEEEISQAEWVKLNECKDRVTFSNDIELLNMATEYLKNPL